MYSMSILGLHKSPDGQLVLAADPGFPSMINLHNALFDLIQCFEASRSFLGYRARFEVLGSFCRVARICLPRNRYGAAHPSGLVEEQDSQPFLASLSS